MRELAHTYAFLFFAAASAGVVAACGGSEDSSSKSPTGAPDSSDVGSSDANEPVDSSIEADVNRAQDAAADVDATDSGYDGTVVFDV